MDEILHNFYLAPNFGGHVSGAVILGCCTTTNHWRVPLDMATGGTKFLRMSLSPSPRAADQKCCRILYGAFFAEPTASPQTSHATTCVHQPSPPPPGGRGRATRQHKDQFPSSHSSSTAGKWRGYPQWP